MAPVNTHIYELSFQSIFIFKNKCLLKKRNHLKFFLFYGRPHDPGLHDKVLSPCKLSLPLLCSFDGTQQDELMASEHRGGKRRDEQLTALLSKTEALGADLEKEGGCSGQNPFHRGKGKSMLFCL